MATIDHDRQLNRRRPPIGVDGVERRPHRPSGEEHVVDQHDRLARRVTGDVGHRLGHHRAQTEVVSVHGGVERAGRHLRPLDVGHSSSDRSGEFNPARLHADDHHIVAAVVLLKDLMGHATDRPGHIVGRHDMRPCSKGAARRLPCEQAFTLCH